jgi:hypothetical protein
MTKIHNWQNLGQDQDNLRATQKIEFVNYLSSLEMKLKKYETPPNEWKNIALLPCKLAAYDTMLAWDENPKDSVLFFGYWNDGVV